MGPVPLQRRPIASAAFSLALASLFAGGVPPEPAYAQMQVALSRQGAQAGGEVTVSLTRLPPSTPIYIGFGGLGTPHELVGNTMSDADGALSLNVRIPTWAERNRSYFFFLAYSDQRPRAFSDPFIVTGPEDAVRVRGYLEHVEAGCALLRGFDETPFSLTGLSTELPAGTRVVVDGALAQAASPDGGQATPCQPPSSIVVRVRQIQAG